jgi:hypothetical protein
VRRFAAHYIDLVLSVDVAEMSRTLRILVLSLVGFTQAFGVFQAHYTRTEAAAEGIVRFNELESRALVSSIGSLGNGGIVAVFAVSYYPYLPCIGMHVRYLCSIGTACIVLGLATAAASHSVSAGDSSFSKLFTDLELGLAPVRFSGYSCRHRNRHTTLCSRTNTSRVLSKTIGARPRNDVYR